MSKWLLIAGAVLGIVAVVLVNLHISRIEAAQKTVQVLRLKPEVALAKGERVQGDMLQTEVLPERFSSITNLAVGDTQDARQWIENRPVAKDVPAGSLLLHDFFVDDPGERFAARIGSNMRALTLTADSANAVAFFIQPGSRVDIVGTFERRVLQPVQGSQQPPSLVEVVETKTILQNVKVLAVDRATTRGSYLNIAGEGFQTVTIEVSPEDAEKVIFARNQANAPLDFVLRNPDDDELVTLPTANWNTLE